jgi:redox-sensing transcriptional repressor
MDDLKAFSQSTNIDIAYICTSRSGAQDVADALMACKVKAIWNFAPVDLKVDEDVIVENVHLIDNLLTLTYFVKEQ